MGFQHLVEPPIFADGALSAMEQHRQVIETDSHFGFKLELGENVRCIQHRGPLLQVDAKPLVIYADPV